MFERMSRRRSASGRNMLFGMLKTMERAGLIPRCGSGGSSVLDPAAAEEGRPKTCSYDNHPPLDSLPCGNIGTVICGFSSSVLSKSSAPLRLGRRGGRTTEGPLSRSSPRTDEASSSPGSSTSFEPWIAASSSSSASSRVTRAAVRLLVSSKDTSSPVRTRFRTSASRAACAICSAESPFGPSASSSNSMEAADIGLPWDSSGKSGDSWDSPKRSASSWASSARYPEISSSYDIGYE